MIQVSSSKKDLRITFACIINTLKALLTITAKRSNGVKTEI